MYNHRGQPTGTNHEVTPQAEKFRRQGHPLQGLGGRTDTVGTYLGSAGTSHFFSAEATGGGSTDSLQVNDPDGYTWPGGVKGEKYTFGRKGTSADISSYNPRQSYGLAGAPLGDTPEDMADHKFKGK
jgi:hypothetical protein